MTAKRAFVLTSLAAGLLVLFGCAKLVCLLSEFDLESEPVDFVVSWVNGSDAAQRALYTAASQHRRWRDWDELRYCLRSIEANAPWARRIIIVVNNDATDALPVWLNTSHPRLRVVRTAVWPTANSNAVEANLHQIEGLSQRFIYMNNDWFLRGRVGKSLFLRDSDTHWVFPSVLSINGASEELASDGVRERALKRNARLLDQRFGYNPIRAADLHAPLPIDKTLLRELSEDKLFARAFSSTSKSVHRSEDDVIVPFLYPQYALGRGKAVAREPLLWGTIRAIQFGLRDSLWRNRAYMLLVLLVNPLVMCVNDDVSNEALVPRIASEFSTFLAIQWPVSSTFEVNP